MKSLRLATIAASFLIVTLFATAGMDEAKKVEGVWVIAEVELAGKKLPAAQFKDFKLTLKDGKYVLNTGETTDKGTYKMYPKKKPKALDITGTEGPNKGKKMLAIYELRGDRLRVCYDLSGTKRPTAFKTKANTTLFLATYKRAK